MTFWADGGEGFPDDLDVIIPLFLVDVFLLIVWGFLIWAVVT